MPAAQLRSKGRVTSSKEVRDALHVDAGDRMQFFVREDGMVELRARDVDLTDLFGIVEHKEDAVSVEAINEAVGKAVVASFEESVRK